MVHGFGAWVGPLVERSDHVLGGFVSGQPIFIYGHLFRGWGHGPGSSEVARPQPKYLLLVIIVIEFGWEGMMGVMACWPYLNKN